MNPETLKKYIHPIHKEGYIFIAIFFIVSILLHSLSDVLGAIGYILTAWCVYFFRDPKRHVPQSQNLIISSADGIVSDISIVKPPAELTLDSDEERYRVSVFLSVIDVHVNRTPVAGKLEQIVYQPGKFLSAELDKASEENERNSLVVRGEDGNQYVVVQIAGLIARRIKCEVEEGMDLAKGDRIGIIRFGSRVDIYLPKGVVPAVAVGQRTLSGETVIADTNSKAKKLEEVVEI